MNADERQIREVHSTWIDAVNAGDLARLPSRITIYRKQPGGRWLLARDAHTLSPVEKAGEAQ